MMCLSTAVTSRAWRLSDSALRSGVGFGGPRPMMMSTISTPWPYDLGEARSEASWKRAGMDIYIGFDSAWTDNPRAPGAICAVSIEEGNPTGFHAPQLVSFDQALTFIQETRSTTGVTLVALDQPTVVPNLVSMRPVERVAASLVSWLGGGVQPANRGRQGMFCDASPIWRFLTALGAEESPEQARAAANGLYLMEVFPAL